MKRLYVWILLLVAAPDGVRPQPAHAARGVPVGRAYLGHTTLQSANRQVPTRFVLDRPTSIYWVLRVGVLDLSTGRWPFETRGGHNCDRAELFALPWFYHARGQPRRRPSGERVHARTARAEAGDPRWPPCSVWPPFDWPLRP